MIAIRQRQQDFGTFSATQTPAALPSIDELETQILVEKSKGPKEKDYNRLKQLTSQLQARQAFDASQLQAKEFFDVQVALLQAKLEAAEAAEDYDQCQELQAQLVEYEHVDVRKVVELRFALGAPKQGRPLELRQLHAVGSGTLESPERDRADLALHVGLERLRVRGDAAGQRREPGHADAQAEPPGVVLPLLRCDQPRRQLGHKPDGQNSARKGRSHRWRS